MTRTHLLAIAVTAVTACTAAPAVAAPGDLDFSFGTSGITLTAVGNGNDAGANALVAPDPSLLVAGGFAVDSGPGKLALARYNADGALDTGFGAGGSRLAAVGTDASAAALATGPGGTLVLAGSTTAGIEALAFGRFSPGGTVDGTFNAGTPAFAAGDGGESAASAVVVQGTNVVAAGRARDLSADKFAVVRVLGTGLLDTAGFGTNGVTVTAVGNGGNAGASALAAVAGDKLVAAGSALDGGAHKLALVRYTPGGLLDPSGFGTGGISIIPAGDGGDAAIEALLALPDGSLLAAGHARDGGVEKLLLARFTAAGAPDPGFGTGGIVLTPAGDGDDVAGAALGLDGAGRILVAGHATDGGRQRALVARFTAGGALDAAFGGVRLISLGEGDATANGLVVQADGRPVVAGTASDGGAGKFALTRLEAVVPTPPGGGGDPPGGNPPGGDPPGGTPPGGNPPGGNPPPDVSAPKVSASLTNKRFRAGPKQTALSAAKKKPKPAPVGTTIRTTLSEPATETFTIEKSERGVTSKGKCVAPSRKLKGKACTRFVRKGVLTRKGRQGSNSLAFSGRIGKKALATGAYRVLVVAVDAAKNRSKTVTSTFTVVSR
jgi:uncharacterized delta-60 repeat protein